MTFSLYNNRELHNTKGRLYFYDNAKFILIFLVVAAHFLSPLKPQYPGVTVAWTIINAFHMPRFSFISGFFAKSYIASDRTIKVQRTATYIILFLFAQITVTLFEWYVLKDSFPFSLFHARSSLWFLQCLIIWHLVLPFAGRFKAWFSIPVAAALALYIGYDTNFGNFIALSRVFVHFPFFLCGYYCTQKTVDKLRLWKVRIPLWIAVAGIVWLVIANQDISFGKLLTSNYPYAQIPFLETLPYRLQWLPRLGFYVCAVILGAAFLSIVPRGKVIYTPLGSKSLSVYICHRFVYLAELEYDWTRYFPDGWGIAAIVGIALALTILFSLKPFTLLFDALQKIPVKALLRDENRGKSGVKKRRSAR